jgi:ribosome-associated protein
MLSANGIVAVLDEHKAEDITAMPVTEITSITDHMIICTARSQQHAKALASHVSTYMKQAGFPPLGIEGLDGSGWILVDGGDAIVHIMLEETRAFYSLEKMWAFSEEVRANEHDEA